MTKRTDLRWRWVAGLGLLCLLVEGGCVERRLKVNTEPQGASIILNDEYAGESPVEVSFKWYGDFAVQARKSGYQTLKTHRELKAPWYDRFPCDFFAQILNPHLIEDRYEWTFELTPKSPTDRQALISEALQLKRRLEQRQALP